MATYDSGVLKCKRVSRADGSRVWYAFLVKDGKRDDNEGEGATKDLALIDLGVQIGLQQADDEYFGIDTDEEVPLLIPDEPEAE